MFVVVTGTISSTEGGKPKLTEDELNGRTVQTLGFVLNSSVRTSGGRKNYSAYVTHTGQNLQNMARYFVAGRKVMVRGEASFDIKTIIDTNSPDNEKKFNLRIFIRTLGQPELLDDEPIRTSENFISTMYENGIITEEQRDNFTKKMADAIMSGSALNQQKGQQHNTNQKNAPASSKKAKAQPDGSDANDISALAADESEIADEDKPNEEDIPR